MMLLATCLVIIGVLLAIRKQYDVRLVLMLAGIVLTIVAGKPLVVLEVIGKTLSNTDVTGPICSAMGYAFVLRSLGADRELVALLARPLRKARWLLVPGGCLIGFVTNAAIPSQTATAAAVGPILIPLMLAAGYNRVAAGATLLLGCSIGGNLLNPGDADVVTVRIATNVPQDVVMAAVAIPNILALVAAVLVLMFILRRPAFHCEQAQQADTSVDRFTARRFSMAMLAPLPVLALIVTQPRLNLFPGITQHYPEGLPVYSVMFASTFLAMIIGYRSNGAFNEHVSKLTSDFFDGMGYGLAKVISIIIAAACFLAGLQAVGLIQQVSMLLLGDPTFATIASPLATWLMAMLSGSGTAPAVSFAQAVLPSFVADGQIPLAIMLGVMAGIGANVGRTMSPVSAVMYFVSDLVTSEPRELIAVVALPLVAALGTVIVYGLVSS
jgi:DcuC family C4-dicarboxylate transporter